MFMALRRNIITATGITSLKLFIYGYTNSYIIYVFQLNINNISLVVFLQTPLPLFISLSILPSPTIFSRTMGLLYYCIAGNFLSKCPVCGWIS